MKTVFCSWLAVVVIGLAAMLAVSLGGR